MMYTSFHYLNVRYFVDVHKLSLLFFDKESCKVIMSYPYMYPQDHKFVVRTTQVYRSNQNMKESLTPLLSIHFFRMCSSRTCMSQMSSN